MIENVRHNTGTATQNLQSVPLKQLITQSANSLVSKNELERRDHLVEGDIGYRFFPTLFAVNQASIYLSHQYLGDRMINKPLGLVRWLREESEIAWDNRQLLPSGLYRCKYRGAYWFMELKQGNSREGSIQLVGVGSTDDFSQLDRSFKENKDLDITAHVLNRVSLRMYDLYLQENAGKGIVPWLQDIFAKSMSQSVSGRHQLKYDDYCFIAAINRNRPGCLTLITVYEKH